MKPTMQDYREQRAYLEFIAQDAKNDFGSIDNENDRKEVEELVKLVEKSCIELAKLLARTNHSNPLLLVQKEWQKTKTAFLAVQSKLKDPSDIATAYIMERLESCFNMVKQPELVVAKQKVVSKLFQLLLNKFKTIVDKMQLQPDPATLDKNGNVRKIFISYSWFDLRQVKRVERLALDFGVAGLPFILDKLHNKSGSVVRFTENVSTARFVMVIGTPCMLERWNNPQYRVLPVELEQIAVRTQKEAGKLENEVGIIKLLFDGEHEKSYPSFLEPFAALNFTESRWYPVPVVELVNLLIDRLYPIYYPTAVDAIKLEADKFKEQYQQILDVQEEVKELYDLPFVKDLFSSSPNPAPHRLNWERGPVHQNPVLAQNANPDNNNNNPVPQPEEQRNAFGMGIPH